MGMLNESSISRRFGEQIIHGTGTRQQSTSRMGDVLVLLPDLEPVGTSGAGRVVTHQRPHQGMYSDERADGTSTRQLVGWCSNRGTLEF